MAKIVPGHRGGGRAGFSPASHTTQHVMTKPGGNTPPGPPSPLVLPQGCPTIKHGTLRFRGGDVAKSTRANRGDPLEGDEVDL
jgi:hypothetical protein